MRLRTVVFFLFSNETFGDEQAFRSRCEMPRVSCLHGELPFKIILPDIPVGTCCTQQVGIICAA